MKFLNGIKALLGIAIFSFPILAKSQGLGPQIWPLTPKGMLIPNAFYLNLDTNTTPGGDLISSEANVNIQIASTPIFYHFGLGNTLARIMVIPSYTWLKGDFRLADQKYNIPSSDGFGDTEVLFAVGLVNTPALNLQEFVQYTPKTQVNLMVGATAPTGRYSSDKLVNIGSNRWSFRVSVPVVVPLSANKTLPANYEFVPSLYLYTDTDDNVFRVSKGQEPKLFIEQHVSKYFTPKFWGSIDFNYEYGAKVKINDRKIGENLNQFATGATLGLAVVEGMILSASYGKLWISDEDTNMFRAGLTFTIPSKKDREFLEAVKQAQSTGEILE